MSAPRDITKQCIVQFKAAAALFEPPLEQSDEYVIDRVSNTAVRILIYTAPVDMCVNVFLNTPRAGRAELCIHNDYPTNVDFWTIDELLYKVTIAFNAASSRAIALRHLRD